MLKEGNIVKLSDENKYVVIKHLEHEGINYYYVFKPATNKFFIQISFFNF